VATNPLDIPNGYSIAKHENLRDTIGEPGSMCSSGRAFACHESGPDDKEPYCIGWLTNQLGPGNNIALRLRMLQYDLSGVKLDGDQHQRFEDTLP